MKLALVVLAGAVLIGCPTNPPVPPSPPDASDASAFGDSPPVLDDCQAGCAALTSPAVRCPLGDGGADCAGYLRTINETGKEPVPASHKPLTCAMVKAVKTRADAVALGFVCPP